VKEPNREVKEPKVEELPIETLVDFSTEPTWGYCLGRHL